MKFLITGASGLIGKKLLEKLLNKDVEINILTTSKNLKSNKKNIKKFYWNPEKGIIDSSSILDVNVVINLAGSPIAQLWTTKAKNSILNSRIKSVELLNKIILEKNVKIKQFLCASAIGIYKSSNNFKHHENSKQTSKSFLGYTVKKWEDSCKELSKNDIKITFLRIGLVLSNEGGFLKPIIQSIKFYMGTWFGNGKNIYSWIHIDDLVNSIIFLIENDCKGVYNLVAPNPVTSKQFTLSVSRILEKKIIIPSIPQKIVEFFAGSMSELLLFSQNVSSRKIESKGFRFKYSNLNLALKDLLK
ncbi:MAG: TIGR01777 family protein [Flavobacteriaceae bacterium]|nr:TIGR01777 family protein [Flavobacteriaceae bacterium]